MNKMKLKYLSILVILLISAFNTAHAKRITMEINEKLVDCVGVAPMKCMQVKFKNSKDWENFYSNIEGFEYEEGYIYKIRVKRTKIKNPPADASAYRYELSKIIKKTKVKNPDHSQEKFLTENKWSLIQFKGKTEALHGAFMAFNSSEKQVHGNTSCNNFFGGYRVEGNKISFGQMGVTRMACLNDNIESEFLKMLNSKNLTFDLADQTFNIYQDGKLIAIFGLDQSK